MDRQRNGWGANQLTLANGLPHVGQPLWAAMPAAACSLDLPQDWKMLLKSSCLSVTGKEGLLSQSLPLAFPSLVLAFSSGLASGVPAGRA